MRTSNQIIDDIETIREDILSICQVEKSLLSFDLSFYVNQLTDLKRELRLALIEERQ